MRISDWSSDVCSSDLHPYPGAFTRLDGADLRIWAAAPSDMGWRHAALPGQVVARTAEGFTILCGQATALAVTQRSEEHTSELQSLMRISYAVFCLKKKKTITTTCNTNKQLKTR